MRAAVAYVVASAALLAAIAATVPPPGAHAAVHWIFFCHLG